MKRVVLTGSSGFIGQALKKHLISSGINVAILVRPDSSFKDNVDDQSTYRLQYTSLKDEVLVSKLREWQPDVFIHLAWKGVSGSDRNQPFQFTENISHTLDSVELAYNAGCRQWIGTGSQAEYGIVNEKINEEVCCQPVTAYGKAKLAAGIAALGMCELLSLKGSWCRIFSVFGPGDNPAYFIPLVINNLENNISPALTACEQQWDYLFISDAVDALVAIAETNQTGIFNIGSGNISSLKQVVEIIREQVNPRLRVGYGKVPYTKEQVMHLEADITRIKQRTGWTPKLTLRQGISETIQHFKQ